MRSRQAKWRRWHASIAADLRRLEGWREAWRALRPTLPAERRAFVDEIYAHALAMGVRRQLKMGSRDVSMARLLADLAADAGTHSGAGGEAGAESRLAALRRASRPAEMFADRAVAHADRRARGGLPLDALHAALDRLLEVHAECAGWLGG
jgi:hypothetical protein